MYIWLFYINDKNVFRTSQYYWIRFFMFILSPILNLGNERLYINLTSDTKKNKAILIFNNYYYNIWCFLHGKTRTFYKVTQELSSR